MIIQGHFYFIDDRYFLDFPDPNIQKNHEVINGNTHDKPCFCGFQGDNHCIFWLIPISSRVDKYHRIANKKISKYGKCDTILFGEVLGREKAFLIQNMMPITDDYIKNEYLDKNGVPVRLNGVFETKLINTAKDVLKKYKRGMNLIFPDIITIENALLNSFIKE